MARALRARYPYRAPDGVADVCVVGAGVVGLAVAARLARAADRTTFVVERRRRRRGEVRVIFRCRDGVVTTLSCSELLHLSSLICGSSRNSSVIHAGIYYPRDSLKTELCCRGRPLLYRYAADRGVAHRKTQKLVVATAPDQLAGLRELYAHARDLAPVELLSGDEARALETDLSCDVSGALLSRETGIVDVHGLCAALEADVEAAEGQLVYGTRVVRVDRLEPARGKRTRGDGSDEGWVVQTVTADESSAILAKAVVNAAGLSAQHVVDQISPERRPLHYAKGSYFAYSGPGVERVERLIYPSPEKGLSGLGTHLTMDLAGGIRFGPDVEWLDPPADEDEAVDFWQRHLTPSDARMQQCIDAVQRYLPGVRAAGFRPDYAGIRPKLARDGFRDFEIRLEAPGFVNLLGIESPGLTASLAIAERVEAIVKRDVWGLGRGTGKTVAATGAAGLDAWA